MTFHGPALCSARSNAVGEQDESDGFRQEDVPQVQDHPAAGWRVICTDPRPRPVTNEDWVARIVGINIPHQHRIGLTAIYGIGRARRAI
jgi:hypothetical protein